LPDITFLRGTRRRPLSGTDSLGASLYAPSALVTPMTPRLAPVDKINTCEQIGSCTHSTVLVSHRDLAFGISLEEDHTEPGAMYQPLNTTKGSFSVITALLATRNHEQNTILSFRKRAEGYPQHAWEFPDCCPTDLVNPHIAFPGVVPTQTIHFARISRLALSYLPSLLLVFQRVGSPSIHPVLYIIYSQESTRVPFRLLI